MRVLLVEDNPLDVRWVEEICRRIDGVDLLVASTVDDACDQIRRERPDAILCDHRLPDGTSADVYERRRPGTAFCVLTGSELDDPSLLDDYDGAVPAVWRKPVDENALRAILGAVDTTITAIVPAVPAEYAPVTTPAGLWQRIREWITPVKAIITVVAFLAPAVAWVAATVITTAGFAERQDALELRVSRVEEAVSESAGDLREIKGMVRTLLLARVQGVQPPAPPEGP